MPSQGYVVEIAKLELLGTVTTAVIGQMPSFTDLTTEGSVGRVADAIKTLWQTINDLEV